MDVRTTGHSAVEHLRQFPRNPTFILALLLIVVLVAVLIAHWPVLSAQARSFDDDQFLTDNPLVRNPSWSSVSRFFGEVLEPSTVEGYYLPLSMTSLMVDYALGGRPDNLRPFHRTSLLLHLLNTALVVVLLHSLFGQPVPAAIVGLLYGVHPLTVEPIAWIGERKTLLATFFSLWTMMLYVRHARRGGAFRYAIALITFAAALLSKPTAAPLPVLLLLLDFWPLRRICRQTLIKLTPFLGVGIAFGVITIISHGRTAGIVSMERFGLLEGTLLACYNLIFYLIKMIWPVNLTSVYAVPEPLALSNLWVLAGVVGTLGLTAALVVMARRTRAPITGWLFFVTALLPTLGWVQYSWVRTSDKYVYLPVIGILLVLAWGLSWAWRSGKRPSTTRTWRVGLLLAVVVFAAAEMGAARRYLNKWRDTETLFRYMVALAPDEPMPHYNLGHAVHRRGQYAEAAEEYRAVLRLLPRHYYSHNNLGLVLVKQGRALEAIEHYEEALAINPRYAPARVNLGNALSDQGRLDEAIAQFESALMVAGDDPRVHNALGVALFRKGGVEDAIQAYQEAIRLDDKHVAAYRNLGLAFAVQGKNEDAIKAYRRTLSLEPNDAFARNNLGVMLQKEGRVDEALAEYERALEIDPTYQDALVNLTSMLNQQGKADQVVLAFRQYLAAVPDDAAIWNALGDVWFAQGENAKALTAYRRALQAEPDYVLARMNLGVTLSSMGRYAEAIREYRVVLESHPEDPYTRSNLGTAFLELDQVDEAVSELRAAVRLKPDYAAAHFNLANALLRQGDVEQAVAAYRRVLELNPADAEARQRLDEAVRQRNERRPNGE